MPLRNPVELVDEIFEITKSAHAAQAVADVWQAECQLQDVGRYFFQNRRNYLSLHPEYAPAIYRLIGIAQAHMDLCEHYCKSIERRES